MSNAASANDSQTPLQETLERVVESVAPSLGMSRLVGVSNILGILGDARARTKDSHALQMKQLWNLTGEEMPPLADGDDMAGINVHGDTHVTVTQPAVEKPAGMSTLAKAGVAAALVAGGAGLPLAGLGVASLLKDDNQPAAVAPVQPQPIPSTVDRDTYLPYEFSIE